MFARRVLRNRAAALGFLLVVTLIGAAIFADFVAPYSAEAQYPDRALQPPSSLHLMGTDQIGRDQLSRIIFGARASITVGIVSMLIAGAAGVVLGLLAGYYGRSVDSVIMRFMDGLLAFPALLLAIFIVAVLGPSIFNAILAVGIVYAPTFARLTRAQVLSVKEKEYVEAARGLGATDRRIMLRSVLPNCLSPIIVQFTLGIGHGILVEAGLSFLGLGIRPPTPAWGSMLSTGRQLMTMAPWLTTFPGLAIFVAVLGFNLFGDGLREAFDPRLREVYR
ncbi:MAG: ABC transporter permease [Chloroflexi bacterium]|nr:ABC transporter permease [Chloroflexota bacterium]